MSSTPPLTGNEDLDAFLYDVFINGIGGGTGAIANNIVFNDDGSATFLYRYLHVKFADNNVGLNFSNSQVNKSYYGLYNSPSSIESNNPANYTWFKTNGFGNDYKLWYKILGGRKIEIIVSILRPNNDPKYIFDDNGSAIDLDSIRVEGEEIVDTSNTVGQLLDILDNSITESQLFQDLGDRINLIDADNTVINSVNYRLLQEAIAREAAITVEQTIRQTEDESLANSVTLLTASVNNNASAIVTEQTARADADTALASSVTLLTSSVNNNVSAIATEQISRANADTALASDITTLQSVSGSNTIAIQTEATTRSNETGELFGKYTVKIDNNGYVSGFGLASTANNGTPVSDFIIRSDKFAIASPAGPSITPSIPFIVYTTTQNIVTPSGETVTVDPGVYIRNANIEYITADQIDTRGLSIKDNSGNIIFASGTSLDPSYINVPSTWDTTTNTAAAIANQGIFATASKLTNANISTYISNAAIDTAQIKNAAIGTAQIDDLSVTTAKIGNAQVNTLQIAGQAVTIPVSSFASGNSASVTFTVPPEGAGQPVSLIVTWYYVQMSWFRGYIYRNGVAIFNRLMSRSSGGINPFMPISATFIDYPPVGTHTYTLGSSYDDGNTVTPEATALYAMLSKR